jgi:Uma2 family endonuclease
MTESAAKSAASYDWDDYRALDDSKRWEVMGGALHAMSPAPTPRHQKIVGDLFAELRTHFAGKRCQAFVAPIDVKLSGQDIVQPDIAVVCNPDQIKRTHIDGAPSLVVEVLSPSTESRDRGCKLDLYAKSGVKEVWLVTPHPHLIEVFLLAGGLYQRMSACTNVGSFLSPSFPEFRLDLKRLFDIPLEPHERIEVVKESPASPYGSDTE